jgi:hypothetical protein
MKKDKNIRIDALTYEIIRKLAYTKRLTIKKVVQLAFSKNENK